jgi:DNA (cytosine-5)-methyltransferase 1
MGYYRAGFDVVGVDIKPQPHYPFEFWQADALDVLGAGGIAGRPVGNCDVVHASPPCQSYSKSVSIENRKKHPDLVAETRSLLKATGLPYIIENVPRAPLENPIQLCGSAFGLPIQRHRLFETNFPLMSPGCIHGAYERKYPPAWNRTTPLRVLSISGGYQKRQLSEDFMEQHKAAMGIDWDISYNELSEAIPPVYTQFIGEQLLEHLARVA